MMAETDKELLDTLQIAHALEPGLDVQVQGFAFSPDGGTLAVCGSGRAGLSSHFFDTSTGAVVGTGGGCADNLQSLHFSDDGESLYVQEFQGSTVDRWRAQ